jgi:hypothetical protein
VRAAHGLLDSTRDVTCTSTLNNALVALYDVLESL